VAVRRTGNLTEVTSKTGKNKKQHKKVFSENPNYPTYFSLSTVFKQFFAIFSGNGEVTPTYLFLQTNFSAPYI
jgi:DNA-binding phage protein